MILKLFNSKRNLFDDVHDSIDKIILKYFLMSLFLSYFYYIYN